MRDYWTKEDDAKGTDVDRWLELYAKDGNNFWRSASGHHQNVIDELIDRVELANVLANKRIVMLLRDRSRLLMGDPAVVESYLNGFMEAIYFLEQGEQK